MGMERAYITTTGKGKSRPIFLKMRLHLFSFFCMSDILKRLLRLFLFSSFDFYTFFTKYLLFWINNFEIIEFHIQLFLVFKMMQLFAIVTNLLC